jgi:hypothetical protein
LTVLVEKKHSYIKAPPSMPKLTQILLYEHFPQAGRIFLHLSNITNQVESLAKVMAKDGFDGDSIPSMLLTLGSWGQDVTCIITITCYFVYILYLITFIPQLSTIPF